MQIFYISNMVILWVCIGAQDIPFIDKLGALWNNNHLNFKGRLPLCNTILERSCYDNYKGNAASQSHAHTHTHTDSSNNYLLVYDIDLPKSGTSPERIRITEEKNLRK